MSLYGLIQFISAPIAGSISDQYGTKFTLLLCIGGASFGYLLLALTRSIVFIIISRVISAVFKHTLDLVKIAVLHQNYHRVLENDRSCESNESHKDLGTASSIGRLNGIANLGFIVGPLVGGYLGSMEVTSGFSVTVMITYILFLLNLGLVYTCYITNKGIQLYRKGSHRIRIDTSLSSSNTLVQLLFYKFWHLVHVLKIIGPAKWLLLARLFLAMAAVMYRTHFTELLEEKYGSAAQSRGMILSYMGFIGAFASFSISLFAKRVHSELTVLQVSTCIYVLSFCALSQAITIEHLYLWLVPQVLSLSILRACTISLQSSYVSQSNMGAFLGITSSLTSIARTISPILATMLHQYSQDGPAIGAALLASLSLLIFCSFSYSPKGKTQKLKSI